MIGIESSSRFSELKLLVVASPKFDECDDLLELVKRFKGVVILCGDIAECYEVATLGKRLVGVPSLLSDTCEVKVFRELGILAMGHWLEIGGVCVGGIDAKNVLQCIELLRRDLDTCSGTKILVSTQRLGYADIVGYPRAEDLCSTLRASAIVVCGLGKDFCSDPRVTRVGRCVVVEACCRSATMIRVALGDPVEVEATCIRIER